MGILIATVGGALHLLSEARRRRDVHSRRMQTRRLIRQDADDRGVRLSPQPRQPYVYPDNELSYSGNFLNMLFKMTELRYKPNPILERALDILFILHADHEQNCLDQHHARRRLGARRPVLVRLGGGGGALGPAARRRQRRKSSTCSTRSARPPRSPS